MGLRASDDVIPMWKRPRTRRDAYLRDVALSVLLDRRFTIRVLAICRYNNGFV